MNFSNNIKYVKSIFQKAKIPSFFTLTYVLAKKSTNFLQQQNFISEGKRAFALAKAQEKKQEFFYEADKAELERKYPNLHIVNLKSVDILLSKLREKTLPMNEFRILSKRLVRLVLEEALALEYTKEVIKESPLGLYKAKEKEIEYKDYIGISILRSGNAMIDELMNAFPEIPIGNVLLQRDEETKEKTPKFFFEKIPSDIENKKFLVLDPMLGTGGSASMALEIILKKGAKEENIIFVHLLGSEEGIRNIFQKFPKIKVVSGKIDPILLPNKYLAPGIGDFGDRFYGTR